MIVIYFASVVLGFVARLSYDKLTELFHCLLAVN